MKERVWQCELESLRSFVFSFKGEEALVGACEIAKVSALGQSVTVHVTQYVCAGVCHCVSY